MAYLPKRRIKKLVSTIFIFISVILILSAVFNKDKIIKKNDTSFDDSLERAKDLNNELDLDLDLDLDNENIVINDDFTQEMNKNVNEIDFINYQEEIKNTEDDNNENDPNNIIDINEMKEDAVNEDETNEEDENMGEDNNDSNDDDSNDDDLKNDDLKDIDSEDDSQENIEIMENKVEFKLYHEGSNYRDEDDPEGKKCPVTWKWVDNKDESDIIVMNILDNIGEINKIERFRYDKSRQKLLLMSMESTTNFKVMNEKRKYFDFMIDYRLDSDVPIPYTHNGFYDFSKPAFPLKEKGKDGRGLAVAFISNCNAANKRLEFLNELMTYTEIDSFGVCSHNKDIYDEDIGSDYWSTKMNTIRKYKFTIAFENSNDRDYVTEKFFQPLEAGSVPVFYGTSNIADFAPEHSFIDANDFKNAKELAEYLEFLDQNDEEYESYLEWKKKAAEGDFGENLNRLVEIGKLNSICQLLQRIKNMWINPYLTEWDREDVSKDERACILC